MLKTLAQLSVLLITASASPRPHNQPSVLFSDVNVLTMQNHRLLHHQDVLAENGFIRSVRPHSEKFAKASNARLIDGRGKYLLPGFCDMHIHTQFGNEQQLKLYLVNGITTVLNLSGTPELLNWKKKIASGELAGPNFYTSGPIVDGDPPTNHTHLVVENRVEAEKAVDDQAQAGYDFIKPYSALSKDAYEGVLNAAKRDHIRLVGHVPWSVGVQGTIDAGQEAIAHVEELYRYFVDRHRKPPPDAQPDPAKIPALTEELRRHHTWVITTLSANTNILKQATDLESVLNSPNAKFVPKSYLDECKTEDPYAKRGNDWVLQNKIMVPFLFEIVSHLHKAGVPMMSGTDATNPIQIPGFSLHDELEALVQAGMSPYEALLTTTLNPAIFLHRPAGTVSEGNVAELVLLDADPLQNISNTRRIDGVMAQGRWFDKQQLNQMKEELVSHFKTE
jgi:hypothetical protein